MATLITAGFATSEETAKVLGVPKKRAKWLMKLVNSSKSHKAEFCVSFHNHNGAASKHVAKSLASKRGSVKRKATGKAPSSRRRRTRAKHAEAVR